jgi:hypothetical protein
MEKQKYRKVFVDAETMEQLKKLSLIFNKSVDDVAHDLITDFMKNHHINNP